MISYLNSVIKVIVIFLAMLVCIIPMVPSVRIIGSGVITITQPMGGTKMKCNL